MCKAEFTRNKDESNHDWESRKFCKRQCYLDSRRTGPKIKTCVICSKEYTRYLQITNLQWEQSKVCGIPCRKIYLKQINVGFKKGHPVYSEKGRFKKGTTPWNTGIKGVCVSPQKGIPNIKFAGANNPNWKGGVSKLRDKIRFTYEYIKWRTGVYQRDKWVCQTCGKVGGKLAAHHIKAFSLIIKENGITTVEQAKLCAELWDLSNGVTLCIGCHEKTGNYLSGARRTQ